MSANEKGVSLTLKSIRPSFRPCRRISYEREWWNSLSEVFWGNTAPPQLTDVFNYPEKPYHSTHCGIWNCVFHSSGWACVNPFHDQTRWQMWGNLEAWVKGRNTKKITRPMVTVIAFECREEGSLKKGRGLGDELGATGGGWGGYWPQMLLTFADRCLRQPMISLRTCLCCQKRAPCRVRAWQSPCVCSFFVLFFFHGQIVLLHWAGKPKCKQREGRRLELELIYNIARLGGNK